MWSGTSDPVTICRRVSIFRTWCDFDIHECERDPSLPEARSGIGVWFMKAVLLSSGKVLATHVVVATSLPARMRGLLGRSCFAAGQGLLIQPCKGIHTFFMRFSIDAVFLDRDNRVVAFFQSLVPNRMTPVYRKAHSVLELPAGTLDADLAVGEGIVFS